MTENEARQRVITGVPRKTEERLDRYASALTTAAHEHNLIARSTLPGLWSRHILDSAQLVPLAPPSGLWIDIGTGAGLPGIVVALLRPAPMLLVEPRRLRAEFLQSMIERLGLYDRVELIADRAEAITRCGAACISARAVAPLDRLLGIAGHLADEHTCWVLPKGRSAAEEVAAAQQSWQGAFELVASDTDPEARIVVARGVRPRRGR